MARAIANAATSTGSATSTPAAAPHQPPSDHEPNSGNAPPYPGLLPSASQESAASPVRVSVSTVVMTSATARRRTVAFCSPAPRPATDHCVAPSAAADGQADCHHRHGSQQQFQQQRDGDPAAPHRRRHLGVARPDRAAAPAMPSRSCRSVGRPQGGRATLGSDSPRTDEHHGDDDTKDEAADVCEEPDASAMCLGAKHPEVGLDELIQEPCAEEEPRGDPHQEKNTNVVMRELG